MLSTASYQSDRNPIDTEPRLRLIKVLYSPTNFLHLALSSLSMVIAKPQLSVPVAAPTKDLSVGIVSVDEYGAYIDSMSVVSYLLSMSTADLGLRVCSAADCASGMDSLKLTILWLL